MAKFPVLPLTAAEDRTRDPARKKSNTLPRRYKSRFVPQGSTNVLYTYTPWHLENLHADRTTNYNDVLSHGKVGIRKTG